RSVVGAWWFRLHQTPPLLRPGRHHTTNLQHILAVELALGGAAAVAAPAGCACNTSRPQTRRTPRDDEPRPSERRRYFDQGGTTQQTCSTYLRCKWRLVGQAVSPAIHPARKPGESRVMPKHGRANATATSTRAAPRR